MKKLVLYFLFALSAFSAYAQRYSLEDIIRDETRKSKQGTVTLEMVSHSEDLKLTWELSELVGEKRKISDDTFVYTLTYVLKDEDEGFASTVIKVAIHEISASSKSIKMKNGEVWRGAFNLSNIVCNENGEATFAAEKKTKYVFDSPLNNLTISMDGVTCFSKGEVANIPPSKGVAVSCEEESGLFHYGIIVNITNPQDTITPKFIISGNDDNSLRITVQGKPLAIKKLYRYSISKVEQTKSYEDLVKEYKSYVSKENTFTESSEFRDVADLIDNICKHEDCPSEEKDNWQRKRTKYLDIRRYLYGSEKFINEWGTLSKRNGTSNPEALKKLNGAKNAVKILKDKYPEYDLFPTLFFKYNDMLDKYGSTVTKKVVTVSYPVVTGKTVFTAGEWSLGLKSGIRIYGSHYKLYKPKSKELNRLPILGTTSGNGTFSIVLKDPDISELYFYGCESSVTIKPNENQDITVELSD